MIDRLLFLDIGEKKAFIQVAFEERNYEDAINYVCPIFRNPSIEDNIKREFLLMFLENPGISVDLKDKVNNTYLYEKFYSDN